MSCPPPTAPARVTALQADNDHTTHSLTVSWERPVGVYDGYSLQLLDEAGIVVINQSVAAGSRSELLEGLTSGRWYRVRVVTLSGGVKSPEATAEGQTRESLFTIVHHCLLRGIISDISGKVMGWKTAGPAMSTGGATRESVPTDELEQNQRFLQPTESDSSSSGPAAVSNLTVTSANTSSLSFSWRPSDGHVDMYDLTLYSISEGTSNHRRGSPGSSKEHHKVGLTVPHDAHATLLDGVNVCCVCFRTQVSRWTCRRWARLQTAACSPA